MLMPLLLTRDDLRPLLVDPELIAAGLDAIATSLTRPDGPGTSGWWAFPLAVQPARLNVHAMTADPDGTILRAWPTDRHAALAHGLSLLFGREHGELLAILGGGEYLMWRTAGPVVLAFRYLAPPGARSMAMLGAGIQARYHLIGLRQALPDLKTITVYSRDPANRRAFAEHARAATGVTVHTATSAREAVEGADVICSTAGSVESVLDHAWVRPGALVTDIFLGVPRDLPARIVTPTNDTPYARPSGWDPHPEAAGHTPPTPHTTLAQVIAGAAPARTHPDQTVLYIELGVFPWDTALTAFAYSWAVDHHVGTRINL
jgi:ornithine cyclodeaminase/alanine dehydrogenase-like protein (mu-crystallin family)